MSPIAALLFAVLMFISAVFVSTETRAQPTTSSGAPVADPFPGPAKAMNLVAQQDKTRAVVATVGPAGGQLQTSGSDGTQYRLTIPAGAITTPTVIEMAPISQVTGPLSNSGMGVVIGPNGLNLDEVAMLHVTKRGIGARPKSIAIAGYDQGRDSRRALFKQTGDTFSIPVWHFTIFQIGVDQLLMPGFKWKWVPNHQWDRFSDWVAANKDANTVQLTKGFEDYRKWISDAASRYSRNQSETKVCSSLRNAVLAYSKSREAARQLQIPISVFPNQVDFGQLQNILTTKCRPEAERNCKDNGDSEVLWQQAAAEEESSGRRSKGSRSSWLFEQSRKCALPPLSEGTIQVQVEAKLGGGATWKDSPDSIVERSSRWNINASGTWRFHVTRWSNWEALGDARRISLTGNLFYSGSGKVSGNATSHALEPIRCLSLQQDWAGTLSPDESSLPQMTSMNITVRKNGTAEFQLYPSIVMRGSAVKKEISGGARRNNGGNPYCAINAPAPPINESIACSFDSKESTGPLVTTPIRPNGSLRARTTYGGTSPFFWNVNNCIPTGNAMDNETHRRIATEGGPVTVTVDMNLPLAEYEFPFEQY